MIYDFENGGDLDSARAAQVEDFSGVYGCLNSFIIYGTQRKKGILNCWNGWKDDYTPDFVYLKVVNRQNKGAAMYIKEFDEGNALPL
jgi:hypothetical protein